MVLGVAMLAGYRLPFATPRIDPGRPDHTVSAMFVYGVAYAMASIACTLPLFSVTLFGNVDDDGWWSGVLHVLAYGAGMALIVSALTVTLAVANTSLLGLLRRGSHHVDRVAAVLVVAAGLYLVYYFWVVDVNEDTSAVVGRVERLQVRIQTGLNDHWQIVAVVLAAIVAAAVAYVARRKPSPS